MSSLTPQMWLELMLLCSPCQDFLFVLWPRPRHRDFAKPQHNACGYRAERFPMERGEKYPHFQISWYSQLFNLADSCSNYRSRPGPAHHPDLGNSCDFQGKPCELIFFWTKWGVAAVPAEWPGGPVCKCSAELGRGSVRLLGSCRASVMQSPISTTEHRLLGYLI